MSPIEIPTFRAFRVDFRDLGIIGINRDLFSPINIVIRRFVASLLVEISTFRVWKTTSRSFNYDLRFGTMAPPGVSPIQISTFRGSRVNFRDQKSHFVFIFYIFFLYFATSLNSSKHTLGFIRYLYPIMKVYLRV